MITVTTIITREEMKDLAIANCIGSVTENTTSIIFEMTDRMFKPFFQQAQAILGSDNVSDANFIFQFHNDKYPLLDWK